jgi:TolB protein
VYRRSARIRRRAAIVRGGAAALSLIVLATIGPRVLGSDSARSPARPHPSSIAESTPTSARSDEGKPDQAPACSCLIRPPHSPPGGTNGGSAPPGPVVVAGERIAFASDREDDNFEIYTMNADFTNPRRLTNDPSDDRDPAWSPDGARIAFVRLDGGNDFFGHIYVMDADGSHPRVLTTGGGPRWSPDGKKIAIHRLEALEGKAVTSLWVIDVDGSNARRLDYFGSDPTWTPDGRFIVFGGVAPAGGDASQAPVINVYTIAVDGSAPRHQISTDPVFACEPDVSPDGKLVAYVRHLPTDLFVGGIDGSPPDSIETPDWEFGPTWSSDQHLIAFERDRNLDPHYAQMVGGVGAATSSSRIVIDLVQGGETTRPKNGDYSDADPAFAPRGS